MDWCVFRWGIPIKWFGTIMRNHGVFETWRACHFLQTCDGKLFVLATRNNIYDYGSGINFNQIRLFWSNKLAIIHYIHSSFIDSLSPLNPLFVVDFSASHVWFGNWPFPLGHPKLLADVRRTQSQGHCLQRVPGMDGSSPGYILKKTCFWRRSLVLGPIRGTGLDMIRSY